MLESKIEEIVNTYVRFIKDFEDHLKHKYCIKGNPRHFAGKLFDRKGEIYNFKYQFHGAGCRIEKDDIICEYDSLFSEGNEIDFSLWEFTTFIETHPKYKTLNLSSEYTVYFKFIKYKFYNNFASSFFIKSINKEQKLFNPIFIRI